MDKGEVRVYLKDYKSYRLDLVRRDGSGSIGLRVSDCVVQSIIRLCSGLPFWTPVNPPHYHWRISDDAA